MNKPDPYTPPKQQPEDRPENEDPRGAAFRTLAVGICLFVGGALSGSVPVSPYLASVFGRAFIAVGAGLIGLGLLRFSKSRSE